MIVPIMLTYPQLSMANHVSVMRRIANEQNKLAAKHGAPTGEGSWELDIKGCAAELGVARYLNLFWCGTVNDLGRRDVGDLVDVRSTTKTKYRLPLHPDDPDEVPFVLVWPTRQMRKYDLVGWVFAGEGKQQKWWGDPQGTDRPAFWVPWDEGVLHDMPSLLAWVNETRLVTEGGGARTEGQDDLKAPSRLQLHALEQRNTVVGSGETGGR